MQAEAPRRSIARTALLLLPVQVVFRTGEAIVPLLLAAWFGRTPETDAYYVGWAFFAFAGSIVASAFQDSALIPVLTEVEARDPASYGAIAGAMLGHALAIGAAVAVAMGFAAYSWCIASYEGPLLVTASRMVVPFAAYLVALGVRAFYVGLLNQRRVYFAHPVASGIGITSALAFIAVARHALGVVVLPVAWLAQETIASLVLVVIVRLADIRVVPTLARPEPVRRFFKLVVQEALGSTITRINPVVDQMMAGLSSLVGAGTVLRYAFDVASLPTSAAQATVLPVLLSHFSEDAAAKRTGDLLRTVRHAIFVVGSLLVAASALVAFFRRPILRLVFLHGAMDEGGIDAMAEVLPYALAGVAPFGALLILARAHVALQNSRIMISMGVLNAALNAVFDVVFFQFLGLRGIALSTSMMQLAIAIVFWVRLKKRIAESRP